MKKFITFLIGLVSIILLPLVFLLLLSLVMRWQETPVLYWFPKEKSKNAQSYFEQYPLVVGQVVLKDVIPFPWDVVCEWGSYGQSIGEEKALQELGLNKSDLSGYIDYGEHSGTLLFRYENEVVPVYFDLAKKDRTLRTSLWVNDHMVPCSREREVLLKVE